MNNTTNHRYKTSMCRNFEQTGNCPMGLKCHFAHGKEELRETLPLINNQNPGTMSIKTKQGWGELNQGQNHNQNQNQSGGAYKTSKCKFFEQGHCKFGQNCNFAHGDQDLRATNSLNNNNTSQSSHSFGNSNSNVGGSSIENQVAQQQIQDLGQSLEAYHANNPEFLERIIKANEMSKTGNVQGAASILYGLMSRQDRGPDDVENYAVMTYKMQVLGENLYQQLQSQSVGTTPQLGHADMNQMGGFGNNSHSNSGYKKNYQKSYQQGGNSHNYNNHNNNSAFYVNKETNQNQGYQGNQGNQGSFGTFGGIGGIQSVIGKYTNGGNQGGFPKENYFSSRF